MVLCIPKLLYTFQRKQFGFETCGDIRKSKEAYLIEKFGKYGHVLWNRSHGIAFIDRSGGGGLFLDWQPDCGSGTSYAVYRGDLAEGYDSLSFEPGFCSVAATLTELPLGAGDADFFLVVPVLNGFEGEFGFQSPTDTRPPAATTCHPQGSTDDCAD